MSFSGKVVLVTGAGSGIGAAAAMLFAREGAHVALVDRNQTKLDSVAKQRAAHGAQPLIIKADVTIEQEAKDIVKKTIDHFGKLDVLVNNVGIVKEASVSDTNILKVFDLVMNTNLRSVVQLTNLAVPYLKTTKGNIVNVSSITAHRILGENYMPYSVSKAGLDHFTRCAALDLAAFGIRVNSVNPGPVRTDIPENSGIVAVGEGDNFWEQMKSRTALGRVGEAEEIAEVIAFLASDKAKSVTGSAYISDNGALLK